MCMIDTGDGCAVWHEAHPVARKLHRCASCRRTIAKGEPHCLHTSIYERGDKPIRERMCLACEADRDVFGMARGHFHPNPSSLLRFLDECVDYADSDEEADPWVAMAARIRARGGA